MCFLFILNIPPLRHIIYIFISAYLFFFHFQETNTNKSFEKKIKYINRAAVVIIIIIFFLHNRQKSS